MPAYRDILPPEALRGLRLGISVSQSADLAQLGLLETHLRLALAEVTRAMLLSGAQIVYGGHLDPSGYTSFLQAEIEKYARRDQPLVVCLAWPEHRRLPLLDLVAAEKRIALFGRIVYLDPAGKPVAWDFERGELAETVDDPALIEASLTGLREYMTAHTDARLLLGGRRKGFQGRYPGILEEALLAITVGQPLFMASGFGGATLNIARVLGLDPDRHFAQLGPAADVDEALSDGLARIAAKARETDWQARANGLSYEENLCLSASYRPSEVASYVALGLGRLRSSTTS